MKKWQIWTIVVVGLVLIAAASGGLYWYLTKEDVAPKATVENSQEQKDLEAVKSDLDATADLDTTEIDDAVKEIEAVDLAGV